MSRNTVILNFSVPPALAKDINLFAKETNQTRSELLRDAFKSYVYAARLQSLQEKGSIIAQKLGLESYDDIEEYIEAD